MTKLYYIKLGVSMILVTLEMARKHGEFNGIADTNADVKRIIHIFIYQIAEKIKNRK